MDYFDNDESRGALYKAGFGIMFFDFPQFLGILLVEVPVNALKEVFLCALRTKLDAAALNCLSKFGPLLRPSFQRPWTDTEIGCDQIHIIA
ncbi:MAG: hypothetical protein ABSG91_15305 [Syntrophobacteraceae bacterium]